MGHDVKKLGGKCIYSKFRLTTTSDLRAFMYEGFQTLLQILQNTPKILMTTI
jgi:hypothetical protein